MLEENQIYNIDCLEGMKQLDENSIDLTVTSPPYDDLRKYNGYSFDFENISKELYRVTKDGGVVVWIVGDSTIKGSESGTSFKQALHFKKIGFKLHDTMIYKKPNAPLSHKRYEQEFEYMFILVKGKIKTFNGIKDKKNKYGGDLITGTKRDVKTGKLRILSGQKSNKVIKEYGLRTNIWSIANRGERNGHPAIFPEQLALDHILSWSNEKDIVMDIFMGSGTTAKMALLSNRKYIGFEISQEYCDIAYKRLKDCRETIKNLDKES